MMYGYGRCTNVLMCMTAAPLDLMVIALSLIPVGKRLAVTSKM